MKYYNTNQILTSFNIRNETLKKIKEYLKLNPKSEGKFVFYSENDFESIKKFLIENPNTKLFFQKQTFLKKYGVENPQQLKEIKEKTKQTVTSKYGVDNVSKLNTIKERKIKTLQSHYGDDIKNPMNVEVIKNQVKNNWKNKSDEELNAIKLKYENTNKELYGFVNPMQNKLISLKSSEIRKHNKLNELEKFKDLISINDLCMYFQKCYDTVLDNIKYENINPIIIKDSYYLNTEQFEILKNKFQSTNNVSNEENELFYFIKSIYCGEILRNVNNIINPYELDIYIPELKLAFEFNGIYWHNNLYKDKYYHYNKTKKCEEKGIRLIHVFEDDWLYKTEIVKSMIKTSIGISDKRIYARNCIIKEVPLKDYKFFMNENHLQGFTKATHYLGLYFNDELVQSVGINFNGINKIWELNRMVSKINTQIVGGFSKLIKHSMNLYNINEMNSYVFKAWFDGKGYEKCGFIFDKECPPTYWFIINNKKTNRMNYQKSKIEKRFSNGELSYFNKNETEFENMAKNGINWIWDCGKVRYKIKL